MRTKDSMSTLNIKKGDFGMQLRYALHMYLIKYIVVLFNKRKEIKVAIEEEDIQEITENTRPVMSSVPQSTLLRLMSK